ncbi:nitroreductase family protein [Patescibacteria group bacterium]|nr:nitroreductase family protein [Patescibacteria group bacterium]
MQLNEAIKTRRSIRIFSEKKLEKEILEKIIDAGQHAPSHCNTQGWKFIFIDDSKIKNKIFENGGSFVVKNAPYGILVLYNMALTDNIEYQDWIQSSSAAIQNMLLTIHDIGLSGSWICHLPRKKTLNKILKVKKPYMPVGYIAFGYSDKKPSEMPRKNKINEIYSTNEFNWPKEKISTKIKIKRMAKKIYFRLPTFIKKAVSPISDKFVKKFKN